MKKAANTVLCILIGIGVAFGVTQLSSALTPKGLFVEDQKETGDREELVKLERFDLEQDSDKWVKAFFVVHNGGETAIKDVEIICEFYNAEGYYRDQDKWVLYGEIPAGKVMGYKTMQRKFIHTQSANLKCMVGKFTPTAEAASHSTSSHETVQHNEDHGHHD